MINSKIPIAKIIAGVCLILFCSGSVILSQTLDDKINSIISQMSLEEKVKQLHQEGSFNTADNTRLNIPGFIMSDGPHGVRNGMATSFPVGMAMAATWDPDIAYRVGQAMGKEFHGKGIHQALGPCLDLTLDPRNGRSPESTGEDPFLNAKINTSFVQGIQSTPTIATIKHFFSEYRQAGRTTNDYTLSQRNLLEQHGLQFRDAIQLGGAFSVMSSYNSINGSSVSKNSAMLTTDLRTKWGFPFYVVSDWNSIYNNADLAIKAGCDLEMGSTIYQDATNGLVNLVNTNKVPVSVIDNAVKRVLKTKFLSGMMDYYPQGDPADINSTAHQVLCLEAGKKSLVLLKNQDNILPLNKNSINKIAVIGPNAAVMQTDGSGSSWVDPFYKVSPRDGIEKYVGSAKVLYAKGCDISSSNYSSDVNDAITYASQADVVIFFGGLDQTQEGEGFDRVNNSIELPGRQKDLIKLLSSANKNLIVVLISGGICTASPFINDIKGLLYGFYPGQEGGNAIAQVLFGDYNPSGKLPQTMPMNDSQLPDRNSNNLDNNYGGGYRWFDKKNQTPLFAFGYGLSYTTFSYSNFRMSRQTWMYTENPLTISVDVTNTGKRQGEEVVQLYISEPVANITKNVKDLKGFKKISLEAGETKTVSFEISPSELYYFFPKNNSYEIDPGPYYFKVGGSSDNLQLSGNIDIRPHPPLPDLQIANVYSVPRYPLEGDKVIFLATVINRGTGPSSSAIFHEVSFKVNGKEVSRSFSSTDSIPKAGMDLLCANVGPVDGNSTNYWIAGKPGTYTLEATIDGRSAITEINELNNSKTVSLNVYAKPAVNLALKKSATSSSQESTTYTAGNAVDGNYSTRWSSQFSDPQTLTIDLGSLTQFNQIRITWEAAYGKEYVIETSDDASVWKKIVEQKNGAGNIEKWDVNASGRYVRLTGTKRGTQYGYSIYEFEIYNQISTSTDNDKENLPIEFSLSNNYPNPFNPETMIEYLIPKTAIVELKVYDVLGKEVATLVNEVQNAGKHSARFSINNYGLASGIYFYRISTEGLTLVKKMMLVK